MAGKFDAAIKDLVWNGAPALLELLAGAPVVRFLNTDFSSVRERRPDMLAELSDGSLFHIEFQTEATGNLPWRMLDYYSVIGWRYNGAPVIQMVLYLGEKPSRVATGIDHPNLNFSFALHHISEIDPAPLLDSQSPDDAVLAILCRSGDTRQNIRRILARIAELDPVSRSDAATRLAILAQLRRAVPVVMEEAKSMTVSFNIKTHPLFADAFEEVKLQGVLEGEARGRAATLLRLLRRRYGTVSQDVVDRVFAASNDELDSWTDAVFDAPNLEAIFDLSKH